MKKSAIKERTAEKRAMALQLRKDGHSYEAIGRLLGTQFASQRPGKTGNEYTFTSMYAHKLVHSAIKDIYRDGVEDLVRLEMTRLDDMQLEVLEVLRTEHVLVSSGCIVHQNVRDAEGKFVMGANGLPLTVPIRDDSPRLAAIDRLLKIQERRARLMGIDKPTKVASTNPAGDKPATPWQIVASKEDLSL